MKSYPKIPFAKFLNFQISLSLLASFCVLLSLIPSSSYAENFTFRNVYVIPGTLIPNPGDFKVWSNPVNWLPYYPGTVIDADDEVTIIGHCEIDLNITNNGIITFGAFPGTIYNSYLNAQNIIENNGTLTQDNHNFTNFGVVNNAGVYTLSSVFGAPYFINSSGGIFDNKLSGSLALESGSVFHNNSSFYNYGGVTNNGTIANNNWFLDPGTMNNTGVFNLNNGGSYELRKTATSLINGTLNWYSGGTVIIGTGGNVTLDNLTIAAGQTLAITGRLMMNNPLVNNGTVTLNGKLVLNYPNITFPIFTGFVWNAYSQLTIGPAGNMSLNTPLTVPLNAVLNIEGVLTANPGSTLLDHDGWIDISNGGNLIVNTVDTVDFNLTIYDGGGVTIGSSGSLVVAVILEVPINGFFVNNGTLIVNTNLFVNEGTVTNNNFIQCNNTIVNTGTINNTVGATIFTLWDIKSVGTINNSGLIELNGSNAELINEITNTEGTFTGIFNINTNGNLFYNKNSTFTLGLPEGTVNWNGGKVTLGASSYLRTQSPFTIGASGVFENNGKILVQSTFTNNGTFNNNAEFKSLVAEFHNTGTVVNADTMTIGWPMTNSGTLTNNKSVIIGSGASLTNSGTIDGTGKIDLLSYGELILNSPNTIIPYNNFIWNPFATVSIGSLGSMTLNSTLTLDNNKKFENHGSLDIINAGEIQAVTGTTIKNYGNISISENGILNSLGSFDQYAGNYNLNNSTATSLSGFALWGGNLTIGALADLTIPSGFTVPVTSNLIIAGILRVGTVGFSGGISNNGTFVLNATGSIYFNSGSDLGQMTWNSGGKIIVNSGVNFSVNNPLTIPSGGIFESNGKVQISSGSSLNLELGSTFNIYNGSKLDISSTLTNNGTINLKSGGEYSLRYNTTLPAPSANFIWETGGILSSGGGAYLSLASPYTVPIGRILKMDGGIFSVNKKLTNEGTINLWSPLSITDTLVQNKDFNLGSGRISLQSNGVFILNDTLTYSVNDTIKNDGLVKINQGGALIGDGVVKLTAFPNSRLCLNQTQANFDLNKIVWNDGSSIIIGENSSYEAPDGFSIPANKKFQADGVLDINAARTFNNNGFLTVNGILNDNGTINNNSGATFTNNGISNINGIFLNNGIIANTNTLNLNTAGSLTLNNGNITLDGTFNWLAGGDLTIGRNAKMYLANTLTIPSASTLNVDGLLQINANGNIANNGILSLNSTGSFVIKDTTDFITSANFIWNSGADVSIKEDGLVALSQPFTIPALSSFIIDRGTLELNPGAIVTNNGTIDLNAYGNIILNESPDFLVNGNFNWNTQGIVTLGSGITFNVTAPLTVAYSGVLVNNGKIVIPSSSSINNGGTITNNDSLINNGTLVNTQSNNSFIYNNGVLVNNSVLTNDKWFYNSGDLILNTSGNTISSLHLSSNNSGNLIIGQNGVLDISESVNSLSVQNLIVEGVLNVNSGASYWQGLELKEGGRIKLNTFSSYRKGDGFYPVEFGSSFPLINDFNWNTVSTLEVSSLGELALSDTLKIPANGKLVINGAVNINSSNNVFNQASLLENDGTIELNSGGNLNFKNPLAIFPTGDFRWNGGDITVFSNTSLILTSPFSIPIGRTLNNNGTLNISANGALTQHGTLTNSGDLNVDANGTLTEIGTLTNSGTFNLNTDGEYRIKKAVAVLPSGTFNWNAGRLAIDTASVFDLTNSLLIPTGGTLGIEKNAAFNINSGGVLTEQGTLEINEGALNLNTTGQLVLDKASATVPGAGFAWNAGTLKIGTIGTMGLANALTIPATGIFDIDGLLEIDNGGSVNNLGIFNLNNTGQLVYKTTSALLPNGTFNWVSGGDISINSGSTLSLTDSLGIPVTSTLANNGILNINNLGILANGGTYNGTGITNLNNGGKYLITDATTGVPNTNFNWNTGGIFEITSTGALTLTDSLTIPFERTLTNKGQLTVNQNGSLTQMGSLDNQGTFDLNDAAYLVLKTSPLETSPGTVAFPNGSFNWNLGGVIKIDSFTVFDNATPFSVVANRELVICGTFNNTSTLDINGKVSLAGNLSNTDAINLKFGGELNFLTPTVTFPSGNFDWQEGGDLNISPQSTLTLASSLTIPQFSNINNEGILTINTNGVLVSNGGLVGNGLLNLNNGGKYLINSTVFPSLTSMNWNTGGEIEIGSTGTMEITEPFEIPYGRIFTNKGTVNIGNGAIFSTAKLTQSGTFDNSLGNLVLKPYGTLEYKTSPSDPGPSSFTYPSGNFDWQVKGIVKVAENTIFDNQSPFDVVSGRELMVDGTFENNNILAINGTLTANGNLTNETTGVLNLNDGGNLVLNKVGVQKPANVFNWASGGTLTIGELGGMEVSTAFDIPSGAILAIEGSLKQLGTSILNNLGSIDLNAGGNLILDYDNAPLPTGTFNWQGNVIFAENRTFNIAGNYMVTENGTLINKGIVGVNANSNLTIEGSFINDSLFTNNGIINVGDFGYLANNKSFVNNDTLHNDNTIENLGKFTNSASGNIFNHWDFYNYDTLYNQGIISGDNGYLYTEFGLLFENSATAQIAPGDGQSVGYILVEGDFDLGQGQVKIQLDGAAAEDLLEVRDLAVLSNAVLDISFLANPASTQKDTLMLYGSKTGEFAQVNLPTISGYQFTVTYTAHSVILETTKDCNASEHITTSISENKIISAGQTITGSAIIKINASVTFSAGAAVILEPGFQTESGSVFLADIGGCVE